MRDENTVKCMRDNLWELRQTVQIGPYNDFLTTTIDALNWVLGE